MTRITNKPVIHKTAVLNRIRNKPSRTGVKLNGEPLSFYATKEEFDTVKETIVDPGVYSSAMYSILPPVINTPIQHNVITATKQPDTFNTTTEYFETSW